VTPGAWRAATVLALLALVAAGCASGPEPPPPARLERPEWKVGDRWLFRRTAATGVSTIVTHEVIEATPQGYVVRMSRLGQEITRHWTRELHLSHQTAGGRPLNRFTPPAMYFSWPLALRKAWSQEFEYEDGKRDGHYTNRWRVAERPERVDVIGGLFVALRIDRQGGGGEPLDTYWYVPEARYWVRLVDHQNHFTDELLELQPGPS
jgi:hypothetical protein